MLINANKTNTALKVYNIEEIHFSMLLMLYIAIIVFNEWALQKPQTSRFWLALEKTNQYSGQSCDFSIYTTTFGEKKCLCIVIFAIVRSSNEH